MKKLSYRLAAASALSFFVTSNAYAVTDIQWWHAMTGANNEVVDTLAKEFNDSQKEYKITPVFKGTYPETLNAGIAAFRAKQPPAIIQVFDAGSGVMMGAAGAIKPVADVLKEGGYTFNKADYLAGIVAYYSKPDGTMLSFPYNSSSPILYYNKDVFQKTGLDADPDFDAQLDPSKWGVLKDKLTALFATKTRDEWCAIMEMTDICFAPVLSLEEAPQHPHNVERETFLTVGGAVQPAPAPRYSATVNDTPRPAPAVGADGDAVLAGLGYDAAGIAALREGGAVR